MLRRVPVWSEVARDQLSHPRVSSRQGRAGFGDAERLRPDLRPSAMQADEGFKVFMEEGAELLTLKMKGMKDYYLKNVGSKVFRTSAWCCNTSV